MRRVLLPLTLVALGIGTATPSEAQLRVRGQVALPDGSPAKGVEVRLVHQTGSFEFYQLLAEGRHYPAPADQTLTDQDGSFELRAPEAGMWHLHVAPEGYRPMEFNFWPLLADRRVPTLDLIAETRVKVRVTDPDGEPVAGAHVRATAPPAADRSRFAREFWRPAYRQAITDARGFGSVGRAGDEALEVYAYAPGYHWVEEPSVQTRSVELRLEPGTVRALRIETPRGEPIEAALVRVGERRWPAGITDRDGRIELFLLDDEEPEVHVLTADGRRISRRLDPDAWPLEGSLALTLEPRQLVSGRLVDSDSQTGVPGGFAWISGRPVAFVRSDSTGGFEIPADRGAKIWIWGAATGYLNKAAQTDSATSVGPTILLQPATQVQGVVVDAADRPVAGAKVEASVDIGSGRSRRIWQAAAWLSPAVSDAQGRFTLTRLDPEVAYTLQAVKPGYAPAELPLPDPRAEALDGVRLVLEAGRTIVGSVVDQGGAPVVGAKVELTRSVSSSNPRRFFMRRALGELESTVAFSDQEGHFTLWDLAAGLFDLSATAPGYAPAELATIELPQSALETDVGEVVLPPGFAIEGRVTSVEGAALEGARVFATGRVEFARIFVSHDDDEDAPAAITDTNGFFSVADRAEGEKVDLVVRLSGYAEGSLAAVSVPTYQPVSIRLERASTVRGVVVDEAGRAVPEAQVAVQVTVQTAMMSSSRTGGSAVTGDDGSFTIEGVDPGELELSIQADGFVHTTIGSLRVAPGEDLDDVRAVLKRGAAISGRITGADGRPVAQAQVVSMESGRGFGRGFQGATATDGDGRYRLDGMPPGARTITVRHEEYKPETRSVEVESGENLLDVVLDRGVSVSGRVVDTTGQGVAAADLSLNSASITFMGNPQDVSDSTGGFTVGGLGEGIYTLQAYKEGFATVTLENLEVGPAGVDGLEVRLEPGAAIVGRIVGLEPADYPNVEVYATRPPRGFVPGRVNRDGSYRIGDLGPGEYTINGQLETTGLSAEGHATVVAGVSETVLDLEFTIGLTLTGVVLSSAEPMGAVQVALSGIDVAASSAGMTDSEGRFRIQGLDPGRYQLAVRNHTSGLNHREELEIRVDRDVTVRVEVAEVSGFVRDALDSQPLPGATVQLEPLEAAVSPRDYWYQATAATDSDGYFRFKEVSAGSYELVAQKDGYGPDRTSLTILDGSVQDGVEILLSPTDGLRVYVTLPTGQPAETFVATVFDTAGNRTTSGVYSSENDGGALLSLAPGSWDLVVGTGTTAVSEARVTVPSEPVAIALQPEARLQIRIPELEEELTLGTVKVFDSSGRPFRGVEWILSREEWPLAQGRATVTGLAPGSWSIEAATPDGRSWQGQVQLAAGENPELILQ